MNYLQWNDLIARKFFNGDMAGREVLIYVNEETINQLGDEQGACIEDFIQCIKVGPDWTTRGELCQKALQSYYGWRAKRLEYPPYIAYLAFFVLAATQGGDFDPRAYFPRFWELLGEPDRSGPPPNFYETDALWKDLEKWSGEDKHEELGRFVARIRGGQVHIGRPLSQTLLSDDERKHLPQIFSEAELNPADSPSEEVIRRILLRHGENRLERRTLRLLLTSHGDNIEMMSSLVEFVLSELAEWDGTVPEITLSPETMPSEGIPPGPYPPHVGLRICLEIDRVSGWIISSLRLRTNRPLPDLGLDFEFAGQILSCKGAVTTNWSTKLINYRSHPSKPFDASTMDWSKGVRLEDKEKNWQAVLKASSVRLFLQGNREGLSWWVESHHLERDCEFMVACHSSRVEVVRRWGSRSCDRFEQKPFQGLPNGWSLFEGKGARESCENVDALTLSSLLRIHLQSGIKIGRGNTYLKFGPPQIILEGGYGTERVKLNGLELNRESISVPCWRIPVDAPIGTPLNIEVFREEQNPLQRRVIILEEPQLFRTLEDAPWRDGSGQILTDNAHVPSARGAVVTGTDPEKGVFPHALPVYMSHRIVFLGSKPGEIADWPNDALPVNWQPVWASVKSGRDRWTVYFCGQLGHAETVPVPGNAVDNTRAVKRWKEAIWMRRKKTKEPALRQIRAAWAKYREVAKSV